MAFEYDPIFAVDPSNTDISAPNSQLVIHLPGDTSLTAVPLTTLTGMSYENPVMTNAQAFAPAFISADQPELVASTLDGTFSVTLHSVRGIRDEAAASANASELSASAARDAANLVDAPAGDVIRTTVDADINTPGTVIHASLNAAIDERPSRRTVESFGAIGDGVADDSGAVESALAWVTGGPGRRLVGTSGRRYRLARSVALPVGSAHIDLQGASLEFGPTATIQCAAPTPIHTTITNAGLKRKGTKFTVSSATGTQKGDIVSIQSPVTWTAGVPLRQHYVVQDVDTATGEVWVEGRIVGDITPEQITAAGATGSIAVDFYRLPSTLDLLNARLVSPNRDANDQLLAIKGYGRVRLNGVSVDRPVRTGVDITLCGLVTVDRAVMSEFGYTEKDQGYASNAGDPGGLGFGYGFLVTNTATAFFRDCVALSGWHGIDISRGVTHAQISNCTSHKNAYGFSAHEGAWVFELRGCKMLGGNGAISRAAEFIVAGCRVETSNGAAFNGHEGHQYLSITDTTIDLGGSNAVPFAFSGLIFPAYTRSAEKPFAEVANVTVTGNTGAPSLKVPGDLILDNLRVVTDTGSANTNSSLDVKTIHADGRLDARNIYMRGSLGQFMLTVNGFSVVHLEKPLIVPPIKTPANSAFMAITAATGITPKIRVSGGVMDGVEYVARVMSGAATFDFFECAIPTGRLLFAAADSTVKNALYNKTNSATLTVNGAPVTQSVGNVVLAV